MIKQPLPRIDQDNKLRKFLLPFCRLKKGDIWVDPQGRHKVGCLDAFDETDIKSLFGYFLKPAGYGWYQNESRTHPPAADWRYQASPKECAPWTACRS